MKTRHGESGFALLLVFAMAAAVAILLYTEMPRVVFEGQRVREQTLIDRGEQYQRAIQLYFRKFQRYPARIEDLESTNNIRYLRRRYKDPMTGKDDWRLIHAGPGGVLLDSKVQKLPSADKDKDKEKKPENTFITESLPVGSTLVGLPGSQPGAVAVAPALARRASDRAAVSAASMGGAQGGAVVPFDPNAPQQPGAYPMDPLAQAGTAPVGYPAAQQYPGQPGVVYDPNQPQQQLAPGYPAAPPAPGQTNPFYNANQQGAFPGAQPGQYPGMQGQFPGVQAQIQGVPGQVLGVPGQVPGMPGQPAGFGAVGYQGQFPNTPANSQTGGQAAMPVSAFPQPQQGVGAGAANQNPALDLIRNLLTSPRPGGPIGTSSQNTGPQVGGGIAGVASKYEAEGIKVYNEKTAYQEWEFLYDLKKDRTLGGGVGAAGMIQGAQGQIGSGQQGSFGQSGFGQTGFGQSGFGQTGFGQGTGFGTQPATQQPGFGFPQQSQPGLGFPQQSQPGIGTSPGIGRGR